MRSVPVPPYVVQGPPTATAPLTLSPSCWLRLPICQLRNSPLPRPSQLPHHLALDSIECEKPVCPGVDASLRVVAQHQEASVRHCPEHPFNPHAGGWMSSGTVSPGSAATRLMTGRCVTSVPFNIRGPVIVFSTATSPVHNFVARTRRVITFSPSRNAGLMLWPRTRTIAMLRRIQRSVYTTAATGNASSATATCVASITAPQRVRLGTPEPVPRTLSRTSHRVQ
jgi:hypothetical protein